ncbi:MAG TPA: hypothetical protein VHL31_02430 [Geminicoccus sp.]|jgi:O-antigen/teichoic acid export membrane protein|uniref:hypothetical protein n=1 Tax=Geminicoccus sp. TaxID=2024832 RepID=UPI002E3697CD|nr:hypothetical protein [Geminicoccus sp.]HEX2525142.1 hypothetical protein [Geminicoccus sp.]
MGRSSKFNATILVISFVLGQGSIFLAQTWLIISNKIDLLAAFGVTFSLALFALIVVESGSLVTLARVAANVSRDKHNNRRIWQVYWETTVLRLCVALALSVVSCTYALQFGNAFTRSYLMFLPPTLIIWSFNFAGLLDGLRLSGLSGASVAVAYLSSAIALLLATDEPSDQAPYILGFGLLAGYCAATLAQLLAVNLAACRIQFVRPTTAGIGRAFREGIAVLVTTLPGQATYRLQLLLASAFLGPVATGQFIYVKQVIIALAQILAFIRRAEFPDLMRRLRGTLNPLREVLITQRTGLLFAAASSLCLAASGAVAIFYFEGDLQQSAVVLTIFSLIVFSSAIPLTLTQGLLAVGAYKTAAASALASAAITMISSYMFIGHLGLLGIMIGDVLGHAAAAAIASLRLTRGSDCTRMVAR